MSHSQQQILAALHNSTLEPRRNSHLFEPILAKQLPKLQRGITEDKLPHESSQYSSPTLKLIPPPQLLVEKDKKDEGVLIKKTRVELEEKKLVIINDYYSSKTGRLVKTEKNVLPPPPPPSPPAKNGSREKAKEAEKFNSTLTPNFIVSIEDKQSKEKHKQLQQEFLTKKRNLEKQMLFFNPMRKTPTPMPQSTSLPKPLPTLNSPKKPNQQIALSPHLQQTNTPLSTLAIMSLFKPQPKPQTEKTFTAHDQQQEQSNAVKNAVMQSKMASPPAPRGP